VPYTPSESEDIHAIVVYYIAANGDLVMVPISVYDPATGMLRFDVKHFSHYAVGYNKVRFADTKASFAKEDITYLAARNIIKGVSSTEFAPKQIITRADFTSLLARIVGADLTLYQQTRFTDVAKDAYYAQAVEWAAANGIVAGVGQDRYDPNASITREQVAAIIVRMAGFMNGTLSETTPKIQFEDQVSIHAYAVEAVAAIQQAGIIKGKMYANKPGLYFAPQDHATREEAAKILSIFMKLMMK
jgi:hypothetical protein